MSFDASDSKAECLPAMRQRCHARRMKKWMFFWMALGLMPGMIATGSAQERGNWHATSRTAQSITGDVAFGNEKMILNLTSFPFAEIRSLNATEIMAMFDGAQASAGAGHLYRVSIAGERRFLRKNTLCGGEDVQWMATYSTGKHLEIAMFSSATPPVLSVEALNGSTNLCGTFSYAR